MINFVAIKMAEVNEKFIKEILAKKEPQYFLG
jgi:hypothetical protein